MSNVDLFIILLNFESIVVAEVVVFVVLVDDAVVLVVVFGVVRVFVVVVLLLSTRFIDIVDIDMDCFCAMVSQ
jgi:hypothetical protein